MSIAGGIAVDGVVGVGVIIILIQSMEAKSYMFCVLSRKDNAFSLEFL